MGGSYFFVFFSPFLTLTAEWSLGFALNCWVLYWLFELHRPFPASFLFLPTIVLFLTFLLSSFFGFSFSRSIVFMYKQWVFLAIFFFSLRFKEGQIREGALFLLGISTGLVALYSILQHFTGWHFGLAEPLERIGYRSRSTGFFPVLLSFGLYFSLTASTFLALGWPERKSARGMFFLAVSALSYVAVLYNAGRAGLLSVWVGFILWLFLSPVDRKLHFLVGSAALTLLAWLASPAIFSRFQQLEGYEFEASAQNRRLAVWQRSYEIFQDHPLFGIGADNFRTAYAEKIEGTPAKALGHAHNDFLNVLVYAGILGLAAFLFFWKELTARLWNSFRQSRASPCLLMGLCVLAVYFVYAQFESSLIYREIRMILFFLLGTALAAPKSRTA